MILDKELKDKKGFIRRLKKIVQDFGSVSTLSERIDIPSPTIYRYLTKQATPYAVFFDRLAAIGIDISWLFTGKPANPATDETEEGQFTDDTLELVRQISIKLSGLKKKDRDEIMQVIRLMAEAKRTRQTNEE